MKVGVVSQRVLLRNALCALLVGSGIFASVTDLDRVTGPLRTEDQSQPQVLLVHAIDPRGGIESLQQLLELQPEVRVIFLSDNPNDDFCVEALENGAWGCLSTMDSPQVLVKAVVKVGEGERWFARRVTNIIIERVVARPRLDSRLIANLTPREWEVLSLLSKGYPDKEVASRLFISRETARSHMKSIYKKLQVRTRRAAAVYYFKHVRCQSGLSRPAETTVVPTVA